MSKTLIIFRLYDRSYGEQGNPKTLSVFLREDNTLGYSFYGGWQDSGTAFSISNLQLRKSLPINPKSFRNTKALRQEISIILATGCGSNDVKTFEILNEIKEKKVEGKKYIHEVHSNEKRPEVIIYDVTNPIDNGGRVVSGTIETVRKEMKRLHKSIKDDTVDIKKLDDDEFLFKYIEMWGYTINELTTVTLADF